MTTADTLIVAVLLLGALIGFVRGAIRQVINFAAWVASLVVPYFFAGALGHFVADQFDTPYAIALMLSGFMLGVLAQLVTRLVIALIGKLLRKVYDSVTTAGETKEEKQKDEEKRIQGSLADRSLGALIGAGKWAVIGWVLISGFALIARPLRDRGLKLSIEDSDTYKLCEDHNAFSLIWASDLKRLNTALQRVASAKARVGQPDQVRKAYEALANDDRVKKVLADNEVRQALASGNARGLLGSPHVLSLLTDPQAMEHVLKVATEQQTGALTGLDKQ